MARTPKYRYLIVLQGNYGDGYEDIHEWPKSTEARKEARQDLKSYRTNAPEFQYRTIQRREKN